MILIKRFKSLNVKMKLKNSLTNIYIYRERERVMDKLLVEVIRKTYEYDSTFKIKFDSFETIDCSLLHL